MVHNPGDHNPDEDPVFRPLNVQEYFKDSVTDALNNQGLSADDHTVFYVVNLLTNFTAADELFDNSEAETKRDIKPLASLFADALASASDAERTTILRRLGDVSLYIGGFFSGSLSRGIVDVDYYINMGGSAYGSLSDMVRKGGLRAEVFGQIFHELATKFDSFVDVLSEVSEQGHVGRKGSNQDILRLYEIWMRTGSKRAQERLTELGIQPTAPAKTGFKH